MSIITFFGKMFGSSKSPTITAARITEKPVVKRAKASQTYESRWGHHPVSYETFLKLKELHKWYHATLRHLGTWVRWDRKTVHKHGPEPKYCPTFVIDKYDWWYTENGDYKDYPKTRTSRGIVDAYHQARMPKATPEEVEALDISDEEIDRLHAEVSAWMNENL